jgi:hypothetical protein
MTPEQSKQLKVGSRVCFNGDPGDSGNPNWSWIKLVGVFA